MSLVVFHFAESAFKQQKLPAWQPILTAGTVLPTFFVIGIAFIPIGVIIVFFNNGVRNYFVRVLHFPKYFLLFIVFS